MRHGFDSRDMRKMYRAAARAGRNWAAAFGDDGSFGQEGPFGGRGPFGGGGPMGGRGGGGRRRRMFDRGELRLVLLKFVVDEPRHGYDLIKAIETLSGGEYAPSPGVVYPTLQMMLDEGLIREKPDETSRKVFEATDAGREELAREEERVTAMIGRLSAMGDERQSSPQRQLHRAMDNLRNSLRYHRHGGTLEGETVEQIVDILDDAARRIERL